MPEKHLIAQALFDTLISPNVSDRNLEAANLVDVGDDIARALWKLARTGDPDSIGALEAHGEMMKDAAVIIADAIIELARAVQQGRS